MGLSIHYKGKLKKAAFLPELIQEVKDVAEIYKWKHQIFNAVFPYGRFTKEADFETFYGISFTPENCETISLIFLPSGRMVCPVRVNFSVQSVLKEKDSWIYTNSVKTQFAGMRVHRIIIHFFKYLNEKYFEAFEMMDESYYWETNDEKKMEEQFKKYGEFLDDFKLAIDTFPLQENEAIDDYFKRLMNRVNNLRNP